MAKSKSKKRHKPSDDYDLYDLGGVLKKLVAKKGITQTDFAKKCDLTEASASKLFNNKRQPNFSTIIKILEGLNIKFEELYK